MKKEFLKGGYWSDAFISIAQVFLGVAAGTFFTGDIDFIKIRVVVFTLLVSMTIFFIGWRFKK